MSERSVAQEIASLVALVNFDRPKEKNQLHAGDVQHFIAPATMSAGAAAISFTLAPDFCAVVVAVETFNVDDSASQTTSQTSANLPVTEVQAAQWTTGGDLFYAFPSGQCVINVSGTPQGGKTGYARAVGYILPGWVFQTLKRMSTRVITS